MIPVKNVVSDAVKLVRDGVDVHAVTASLLYSVDLAKVTEEQRYAAKVYNMEIHWAIQDLQEVSG